MRTKNGEARSGLAEAGFAVNYSNGKLWFSKLVDSVNDSGEANKLKIPIIKDITIAILHTHGNRALPTPSGEDFNSPVPNFIRSINDLYVTVPGTKTYIDLKP